ncbi:MAG: branched-chain amino acid ABC transporter permease [Hyphomicrobiales bacterium]|nr:MAG: branched-chain amino acid ABC transporter permease [Hyphomicrobiales bacterium]
MSALAPLLKAYRAPILSVLVALMVVVLNLWMGTPFTVRLLAEATAYGLIALGLNIQFGYGGLFNFGVMGFVMLGGFASVFISFPRNEAFWVSDGPMLLGRALVAFLAGVLLVWGARKLPLTGLVRNVAIVLAWIVAYIAYRTQIDPAAAYIEATTGWVGGLGLYPVLGWLFGGLLAGVVAFFVGKIALGLRTDYLAIATIGISEIIRALIKNMDWLTRGTQTVSPVPWPTPLPQQLQAWGYTITDSFIYGRLAFLAMSGALLVIAFFLVHRAYRGPWGRMMRAIRDNFIASGSMGKNVKSRQVEIFVFGSALMGIGGAILVSFNQILDPSGYQPINHTFLIWVMVILGGAGNNLGVLLGALMIYIVFIVSDPVAQFVLLNLSGFTEQIGWGAIPEIDSRSLQMRVFVVGLVIWLTLRFAPRGLLPEVVRRDA